MAANSSKTGGTLRFVALLRIDDYPPGRSVAIGEVIEGDPDADEVLRALLEKGALVQDAKRSIERFTGRNETSGESPDEAEFDLHFNEATLASKLKRERDTLEMLERSQPVSPREAAERAVAVADVSQRIAAITAELDELRGPTVNAGSVGTSPSLPPRKPIMQVNRERVLNALCSAGFMPLALPPIASGRSCPAKSAARKGANLGPSAFEHAWRDLSRSGEIRRGP